MVNVFCGSTVKIQNIEWEMISLFPWLSLTFQILMYENSHIVVYGYIEAWTYHPMLNISVMPQRRSSLHKRSFEKRQVYILTVTLPTYIRVRSGNTSGIIWHRWWRGNSITVRWAMWWMREILSILQRKYSMMNVGNTVNTAKEIFAFENQNLICNTNWGSNCFNEDTRHKYVNQAGRKLIFT